MALRDLRVPFMNAVFCFPRLLLGMRPPAPPAGVTRVRAAAPPQRPSRASAEETSIMPCINEGDDACGMDGTYFYPTPIRTRPPCWLSCGDSVSWSPGWISDAKLYPPFFFFLSSSGSLFLRILGIYAGDDSRDDLLFLVCDPAVLYFLSPSH